MYFFYKAVESWFQFDPVRGTWFFHHMNLGLGLILSFFVLSNAVAANYDGTITTLKSKLAIALKSNGKKYYLIPANTEIAHQISKLKVNDFISLDGRLDTTEISISAQSLNYVGLKDLIGSWKGNDDYCYSFSSFSELSIFNKNDNNVCDFSKGQLARDFSYTVNPATQGWLVLLSDNDESYIMDLVLHSKTAAELSLYDTRSGDILREIKLKR